VATASPAETDEQGNKLPAAGATRIQLWNLLTGKEISHFLVPGAPATGSLLVLSPDGSKLFTGDFDGPRLWNVETGKLLRQLEKPDGVVNAVTFSADGASSPGALSQAQYACGTWKQATRSSTLPGTIRLITWRWWIRWPSRRMGAAC